MCDVSLVLFLTNASVCADNYKVDLAKRYSFFYLIGGCASGFGGILAYGTFQHESCQP